MGNQQDITMDIMSVRGAAEEFVTVATSQYRLEQSLSEVNKELEEDWEGEAGINFRYAANTIESYLIGLAKRNQKTSGALVDLSNQFESLDEELASGLNVHTSNDSKGGK